MEGGGTSRKRKRLLLVTSRAPAADVAGAGRAFRLAERGGAGEVAWPLGCCCSPRWAGPVCLGCPARPLHSNAVDARGKVVDSPAPPPFPTALLVDPGGLSSAQCACGVVVVCYGHHEVFIVADFRPTALEGVVYFRFSGKLAPSVRRPASCVNTDNFGGIRGPVSGLWSVRRAAILKEVWPLDCTRRFSVWIEFASSGRPVVAARWPSAVPVYFASGVDLRRSAGIFTCASVDGAASCVSESTGRSLVVAATAL